MNEKLFGRRKIVETWRNGDKEKERRGEMEKGRLGERETRRNGDEEKERRGERETRRKGDEEKGRRGERETRRGKIKVILKTENLTSHMLIFRFNKSTNQRTNKLTN